jgi:hypothetical protein
MQLKRSALASLPTYAPRVAQAMKDAGVAFAADGTLSSLGGQDMSQRGRKCSTYAPGGSSCLVTCAALLPCAEARSVRCPCCRPGAAAQAAWQAVRCFCLVSTSASRADMRTHPSLRPIPACPAQRVHRVCQPRGGGGRSATSGGSISRGGGHGGVWAVVRQSSIAAYSLRCVVRC